MMGLNDLIRGIHGPSEVRPALDIFLRKLEAKPNDREDGWHPSSFCDMCARRDLLSQFFPQPDEGIPPKLRRIFDFGTALHEWYQNKYLGPMGVLWGRWKCSRCHETQWGFMPTEKCGCEASQKNHACLKICGDGCEPGLVEARGGCNRCGVWGEWEYHEVPVRYDHPELDLPILGHSDGLVLLQNEWHVLEMKSINERGFNMLPEMKPGHRNQAELYGELIRQGKTRGCPIPVPMPTKILGLYLGKNSGEEKEFSYDLDREKAAFLLSQPIEYTKALLERRMPVRHPECKTMFSDRAKGCSQGTYCFGEKGEQEVASRWDQVIQIRRKT